MSGFTSSSGASITTDQVREWIVNGQGFSASTGMLNSASGTNNYALSVFNPNNSGKNILVYSIQVANGSGGMTAILQRVTSDPGFTAVTPLNAKLGGAASAIAGHVSQATSNQTLSGNYDQVVTIASTTIELLTNGAVILLPNGSNEGLVQYIQTYSTAINSILMRWIEF
jgi:expansin (peptidoglycan-binding protein)